MNTRKSKTRIDSFNYFKRHYFLKTKYLNFALLTLPISFILLASCNKNPDMSLETNAVNSEYKRIDSLSIPEADKKKQKEVAMRKFVDQAREKIDNQ